MNSPDLTRWLLGVRDTLAEHDKIKRDSMLRAADGFLKRSNQQVLVFRKSAKQEAERNLGNSSSRSKGSNQTPFRSSCRICT
jgi:hypothetical protein